MATPSLEVRDRSVPAIDEDDPVRALGELYRRRDVVDHLIETLEVYSQTAKRRGPPSAINALPKYR